MRPTGAFVIVLALSGLMVSGVGSVASAQPAPAAPEAVAACTQFARALDLASLSYSDFANALALGQARPDYSDPTVSSSNTYGRTGLREAVGVALTASRTPGLAPQIAAPMRSWALSATKLVLLMGLRAGVDRFNHNADQINGETEAVQKACADAGTRA
ncbi:hypothetical protein [Mycolicibacterium duvalii]|uniref:Uncharacterized protein n=1 Tax=Mycolicibacterium duvalii TaxID=39688 RepID=A0A7I7K817_9MYCO|nr:hypothetical protein [Mycolicibacterium duvalii]BBX20310.1 hypothetical protein MDUV_51700 [Mycolicibacterium duvalii]